MTQLNLLLLAFIFILIPSAFAQDDVSIVIGTVPQGQQVTINYNVTVATLPAGTTFISNQGIVTGSNFDAILSNDPQTGNNGDATLTQTGFNLPVSTLPSTGETPLAYIVLLSVLIAAIGTAFAYSFARRYKI